MAQSLFKACKNTIRNARSGVQNVGGYDIEIEFYTQDNIDKDIVDIEKGVISECSFGDTDESKIVLVAGNKITIPKGYVLTPKSPKKSLVIMCNEFVNNGTLSMTGKGSNAKPHDYFIMGKTDGINENIVIPAYANNRVERHLSSQNITPARDSFRNGTNGNNGVNRQCGSGGTGSSYNTYNGYTGASGSGSAFAGGAGSGGTQDGSSSDVDTIYPMKGSNGTYNIWSTCYGGIGHPNGGYGGASPAVVQPSGVGGRIIIFCNNFTNNGNINANGVGYRIYTLSGTTHVSTWGGSSGGGAIDLFCNTSLENIDLSKLSAEGGDNPVYRQCNGGHGGDGCVTPLQWNLGKLVKPQKKKFSQPNWQYLFGQYVTRFNEEV